MGDSSEQTFATILAVYCFSWLYHPVIYAEDAVPWGGNRTKKSHLKVLALDEGSIWAWVEV